MKRSTALQLGAVLLLGLLVSSRAELCAPGQGIAKADLASLIGSFLGGSVAPLQSGCSPCGNNQASRGGENAECITCHPLLSAPNADHTACDCLPGSYAASAASASTVQRTCVSCGPDAISVMRNADSCQACPENAKATAEQKCGCAPGFVATGLGPNGVTGCRKCAPGHVSPGGYAIQCDACSEATPALEDNSACGCRAGHRVDSTEPLTCVKCDSPLTYNPKPNRLLACMQCAPYSYATADFTSCVCGGGYYAARVDEEAGAMKCVACPVGTYKAAAGNEDMSACIACPEGTEPSGSKKQCVPARCPPGTQRVASNDSTGASSCQPCSENEVNLKRNGVCTPCAGNTMANPQRTKCDACKLGYLQTSGPGEDLACNSCMLTYKWDEATASCLPDENDKHDEEATKKFEKQCWGAECKKLLLDPKEPKEKKTDEAKPAASKASH